MNLISARTGSDLERKVRQAKADLEQAERKLRQLNQKLAQNLPLALFQQVMVERDFQQRIVDQLHTEWIAADVAYQEAAGRLHFAALLEQKKSESEQIKSLITQKDAEVQTLRQMYADLPQKIAIAQGQRWDLHGTLSRLSDEIQTLEKQNATT